MKKIIALLLVLSMMAALTACKKEPAPTTPTETQPPEVVEPHIPTQPSEIVPDIGDIETMPSAIPEGSSSSELKELYANFLDNYDWTQYNGFTSETLTTLFTCIWTDNAEIYDVKQFAVDYAGSIAERQVQYTKGTATYEFVMTDSGSFVYDSYSEGAFAPMYTWRIVNDTTEYEYSHTLYQNKIIDVLNFTTTYVHTIMASPHEYSTLYWVLDPATDEMFGIGKSDGVWRTNATWASQYNDGDIEFDVDTCIVTLPNKTIKTILCEIETIDNDAPTSSEPIVEIITGELHVDRETRQIVGMVDHDRNTTVTFLTNAVIDFTVPDNAKVNEEFPSDMGRINSLFGDFTNDATRYRQ